MSSNSQKNIIRVYNARGFSLHVYLCVNPQNIFNFTDIKYAVQSIIMCKFTLKINDAWLGLIFDHVCCPSDHGLNQWDATHNPLPLDRPIKLDFMRLIGSISMSDGVLITQVLFLYLCNVLSNFFSAIGITNY